MARKSKRMIMNEAIRQGQARIVKELKSGQMRSDNPASHADPKSKRLDFEGVAPGRTSFLTGKRGSSFGDVLTSKTKLMLLSCVGGLIVIIGLMAVLRDSNSADLPVDAKASESESLSVPVEHESAPQRQVSPDPSPQRTETVTSSAVVSAGDNVIWITRIEINRRNELAPLRDFFGRKGIPTEIIDAGAWAGLVTQEGFEKNPAARGTQGYELLQRIKRLGSVYVEETQDTKFGLKPFQDAYGYKRQ